MSDPIEQFDDELLSAYVDGELDGEELARVERRLADDPEARQLVDDLRALGQEVKSLPVETVGEDLRDSIIGRAERAMLMGTDKNLTLSIGDSYSSRRWMWAALAVAASLLLMAFLPGDPLDEKPIASVKPVPANGPRRDLRFEAVGSDEATADQDSLQPALESELSEEILLADGAPMEAAPSAVRSRSAMGATRAGTKQLRSNEIRPEIQVHITLNEGVDRFENFDRLLVSNGIELEEAPERTPREQKENRQLRKLAPGQQTVQEEVVLIEAPAEQIENVLLACNADIFNCASVRVVTDKETTALLVELLRKYERNGEPRASQLNQLAQEKKSLSLSEQGRAVRLDPNQYAYEADGQLNFKQELLAKGKFLSKAMSKATVQVLFVLQQPMAEIVGEPAAAEGNLMPASER